MGIEVENVTKTYKVKKYSLVTAVNNISFAIPTGGMVGLMGANGAGKSTIIKMMTGILTPDAGRISIDGLDFKKNRNRILLKIGVVFGQRSVLCWDIPVMESLKLFKDMYRIPESVYRENMEMFSDILKLGEIIDKPPRLLSLGQRMKADLAAALLHNPEILFLDEPTIGIDISAKTKIREFIRKMKEERNTTVILTTHDISDIEALCSKVILLDKGTVLYNGTLQELKSRENGLETAIRHMYEGDFL